MPPTPYWGQLPGPRVVENRRQSVDGALAVPSHNEKANRVSVQTTNTEATATTLQPYPTPTNSHFGASGLAPRPPSYQRPPADYNATAAAGPSHQTSQDQRRPRGADDYDGLPIHDVPIGTVRPYREPNSVEGAYPPGELYSNDRDMDYAEPYTVRDDRGYGGAAGYGPVDQPPRRPSETTSGRRKKSATNKSPLEKLELTLNSMTKEEKRARIEAAERRARERAARSAAGGAGSAPSRHHPSDPVAHGSSYPDHPSPSYAVREPELASRPSDVPLLRDDSVSPEVPGYPPVGRHKHSRSQSYRPISPLVQEPIQPLQIPPMTEPVPAPAPVPATNPNVPTRNLSFRERAARDEMTFVHDDERAAPPQPDKTNHYSLTRSGSNKLRKNPPGNPWDYVPAEDAGYRAPVPASTSRRGPAPAGVQRGDSLAGANRNKELPPEPRDRDPRGPVNGAEAQRIQRRATEPVHKPQHSRNAQYYPEDDEVVRSKPVAGPKTERRAVIQLDDPATSNRKPEKQDDIYATRGSLSRARSASQGGLYRHPQWLDEWKNAPVGQLGGILLDTRKEEVSTADRSQPWWEGGTRRGSYSYPTRPNVDGYDESHSNLSAPSRFRPPLFLECGPLLRYCGIRRERDFARSRIGPPVDREIWRGSVMIVTRDAESSYEAIPTLRMFIQGMETLPPAPHDIRGELPPEYVDPIAGHPKLGRKGETLYLRPVEHLDEGKDLSLDETDEGLFEATKTAFEGAAADGQSDFPGSFASRIKRADVDGEKMHRYKDVQGFRLHTEHGTTFWRFNIEVELRDKQQRIAYRINRGPANGFWVPAKGEAMHVMFHSCNGFSQGTKPDELSGPDPMWRDVLNNHQTSPFHVMVGGGDQIYNDDVADECDLFIDWLEIGDPEVKRSAPFTADLQAQVEAFYFRRYCQWFSTGMFGLATSQIPMVNMWSDRETFNGFGSYPHEDMRSPVLSGVGAVSFKYYMLFQHQSILPETEESEPSWVLGSEPGPYVKELARNVFVSLGTKVALLAADCRTERTEDDVIYDKTWERIMDRLYAEVKRGQVQHLLVVLPVPIAYARVAWLENVLKSKAINPIKALGRRGLLGRTLNNLENGSEMMDDLRDHWTAKNHMDERKIVVEDLQDLAIDKSLRITILSGDVNMAAVGQFYSNPKLGLAKHKDPRYMPNVISSGIANQPPPGVLADALNRRHKTYEFDKKTEESMIPMFNHGVDGRSRKNKRFLPHRNWCSIRQWAPGNTPPPTPPHSDRSDSPPPTGNASGSGLLRRLSIGGSSRPNMSRDSVRASSRPPISNSGNGGGILRSLSRSLSRRRKSTSDDRERPATLTRTTSASGPPPSRGTDAGPEKRGRLFGFGRRNSQSQARPDDGGINGQWGADDNDEAVHSPVGDDYIDPRPARPRGRGSVSHPQRQQQPVVGLRGGGATYDEYTEGDEAQFTARPPQRAHTIGSRPNTGRAGTGPYGAAAADDESFAPKPFHRTPTGLSTKQMRSGKDYAVDLEGGLDICLNVEVNPRDPTGITVPYRLLVPRLDFDYSPEADEISEAEGQQGQQGDVEAGGGKPSGIKRFLSLRGKKETAREEGEGYDEEGQDTRY